MAVVVDASVALAWCFLDEATPATWEALDQVRQVGGLVPCIWPLEVGNAVLAGQRRGRLTEAAAAYFVKLLDALPIRVEAADITRVFGPIRSLANDHGLSAYDAAYLELAMRGGLALASLDRRLRVAADAVGVPLAL
jgi:predicted nucleic acid-binding protein